MKRKQRSIKVFTPKKKNNKENVLNNVKPDQENNLTFSKNSESPTKIETSSPSPASTLKPATFALKIPTYSTKKTAISTSLTTFFKIIATEPNFNLQIISLLPVENFLSELITKTKNFIFVNQESLLDPSKINVFIRHLNSKMPKNIFYNNKYNFSFVPIFYKPNNLCIENIGLEKLRDELMDIDKIETIVLMGCKLRSFNKISEHLMGIDTCFENTAYTQMLLNSLVKKGFLKRMKDMYKIMVGKDVLIDLAERFGINKAFLE